MSEEHPLVGRRVRLLHLEDPYSNLQPGDVGTVRLVDSMGTIHIQWDKGSNLGLVPQVDSWEEV